MNRSLLTISLGGALLLASSASAQWPPSLNTIYNWMNNTEAAFPNIAKVVNLTQKYGTPQTWQGRDMFAIKISDNVDQEEDEKTFLMVSSHHSNEYGTPIVAIDAMERLTQFYGTDPTITALVNDWEIWIAPVWNPDGYPSSRHNRNPTGTVDLNRNYDFNWNICNTGIKGVSPNSEPETQTMVAFHEDQRFTKVLDYHSSGREVLYGYRQGGSCPTYVMQNYIRNEAIALSNASGYGGRTRGPSSNGEHYEWSLGVYSNMSFLTEISNTQSPSQTSAWNEASTVWPGTIWYLQRPVPVRGHVTDANTGAPVEASITYLNLPFTAGETNHSDPLYGRYHAFVPNGAHTLRFEHPCYVTQDIPVNVGAGGLDLEVSLVPICAGCTVRNGSGINPAGFDCQSNPELGTNWDTTIATNGNTIGTLLVISDSPAQLPVGNGELLVALNNGPIILSGNGSHSVAIPNDPFFLSQKLCTQGIRIDNPGGVILLNAQDVTLGNPIP